VYSIVCYARVGIACCSSPRLVNDNSIVCAAHGVYAGELNEEDLLANDNSIIVVTRAGYIKRMPLADFQVNAALILLTLLHTRHVYAPLLYGLQTSSDRVQSVCTSMCDVAVCCAYMCANLAASTICCGVECCVMLTAYVSLVKLLSLLLLTGTKPWWSRQSRC
jgi:hypothetical protein